MIRRSKTQWCTLFTEQASSGLSAAEFCRQQALCPKYFSKRKRQLGWDRSSAFVKITPATARLTEAMSPTPDGIRFRMLEFTVPSDRLNGILSDLLR